MIRLAFLTTDNREQHGRYEVEVPYFGTAMEALLDGFARFPDEVEVHVISCTKRQMSAPQDLAPNIRFHQPVVGRAGWGRAAFVGCGLAVRKVLNEVRPDVVHAQGTERDCGVSMMMMGQSVPRLLTIHGHMGRIAEITGSRFPSYYWMVAALERRAVRRADGVVCLNEYTLGRVSGEARRTWIAPNAVDAAFFEVANEPEPGLALCVAGINPWKRQVELIEALDDVPQDQRPEVVFLGTAGEDPYGRRFKELVAQRDWCRSEGNVGRAELRTWMGRASVLILPSIEDNCPMVILEAMAAGVPVAAAAVGGVPDLIRDGETGMLFDPRNADEIRRVVSGLVFRPVEAGGIGAVAQKEAKDRFHPRVVAQNHLDIYRDLIGT